MLSDQHSLFCATALAMLCMFTQNFITMLELCGITIACWYTKQCLVQPPSWICCNISCKKKCVAYPEMNMPCNAFMVPLSMTTFVTTFCENCLLWQLAKSYKLVLQHDSEIARKATQNINLYYTVHLQKNYYELSLFYHQYTHIAHHRYAILSQINTI